ncbi:hypothetical protein PUN28_012183 [Cardiocondyla obscurior]|uniref:Ribosomal RNA processing protein 1 homolog n=1 Tax=Cardiocondyla obscurior TaxID=286306 RepID=A0AAW2FCT2_9HYME
MAVKKRGRHNSQASSPKNEIKTSNVNSETTKNKSKKALIVAQEIKIARLLANNDKRVRDKVLKRLRKWLTVRSQSSFVFSRADFMSLWKGLFYCMWMSDKMLIQEELAESLSKLVHCLNSKDAIVLYTDCALQTLAAEWFGIDQYRLDKFSMLVRRILRQTFIVCKNQSWDLEWVTEISQIFTKLFLREKTSLGFNLHVTDIYLEELAKVSNGNIPESVVHELIKPFVEYLITTDDERQMKHIMRHIFRYLIFQSDIGLAYMEKFQAWKAAGFPCTRIDDMQEIETSDVEENFDMEAQYEIEKPLDPRAGKVDVELPQIPFNAAKIVDMLSEYKFHPLSTAKSRRQLLRLLREYTELSEGQMPLGIKRVRKPNVQRKDLNSKKAARRLIRFEKKLLSDNVDKKKKHKKAINDEDFDDVKQENALKFNNVGSKNKRTIDTTASANVDLRDTDADTVPSKKRKISDSTCDISSTKPEITGKKKLRMETSKKNKSTKILKESKSTKIKLKQKDNKSSTVKNVKHKIKKDVQAHDIQSSNDTDQRTSSSPGPSKKIQLQKINKSETKKTMAKNKQRKTPLKNVSNI